MARRIVPELISPTQASAVHPAFEAAAEAAPNLRFNLTEQAELAKSLLEPGRKVYVDISQESKVSWRKARLDPLQTAIWSLLHDPMLIDDVLCSCNMQLGSRRRSLSRKQRLLYRLIGLQYLRSVFLLQ